MDNFLERWKNDSKYRASIKLLIYTVFFIGVTIYAASLNNLSNNTIIAENQIINNKPTNQEMIVLSDNYNYNITVIIDDKTYKYSGQKLGDKKTIEKESNEKKQEYLYQNGNYYIKTGKDYILTTREEVYDTVNYNYINIDNINMYLSKATKNDNRYLVYLNDIILGNSSDIYFEIQKNDNQINIDYTPLVKEFNPTIIKYKVTINIENVE